MISVIKMINSHAVLHYFTKCYGVKIEKLSASTLASFLLWKWRHAIQLDLCQWFSTLNWQQRIWAAAYLHLWPACRPYKSVMHTSKPNCQSLFLPSVWLVMIAASHRRTHPSSGIISEKTSFRNWTVCVFKMLFIYNTLHFLDLFIVWPQIK